MIHEEKIGKRIWDSSFREKLGEYLGKNIEDIVYKRVYGEEENVEIDGKSYTILPIGNINRSIQGLLDGTISHNNGTHSFTGARRVLNYNLEPITIKDAKTNRIRASYIKHYHDTLGEVWSEKDFDDNEEYEKQMNSLEKLIQLHILHYYKNAKGRKYKIERENRNKLGRRIDRSDDE